MDARESQRGNVRAIHLYISPTSLTSHLLPHSGRLVNMNWIRRDIEDMQGAKLGRKDYILDHSCVTPFPTYKYPTDACLSQCHSLRMGLL